MNGKVLVYLYLLNAMNMNTVVAKRTAAPRITFPANMRVLNNYDPRKVDWVSVISGCKAACNYEKRLCNFYIRAAAHDAMSISETAGGADGSLLLTDDELSRVENRHDNFAYTVSKNALALAEKFNASVADVIAVCGAAATQYLGGINIIKYTDSNAFLVGRTDRTEPNPANMLAKSTMNISDFADFARRKKLSLEEMTALMGSHVLIDTKGCIQKNGRYCDPTKETCDKTSMFTWDNSYYNDVCKTDTAIYPNNIEVNVTKNRAFEVNTELCKYTSKVFRDEAKADAEFEIPEGANGNIQETEFMRIHRTVADSSGRKDWLFTVHDGWMGKACQNKLGGGKNEMDTGSYMRKFMSDTRYWGVVYKRAYKKMVNLGVSWSLGRGYPITGHECVSGYTSTDKNEKCQKCKKTYVERTYNDCPSSCLCKNFFKSWEKFYY